MRLLGRAVLHSSPNKGTKTYDIAEQMVETEDGIERGGADCYYFINGKENPNFSDALPVKKDEEEGRELYNSIMLSMIELYEG